MSWDPQDGVGTMGNSKHLAQPGSKMVYRVHAGTEVRADVPCRKKGESSRHVSVELKQGACILGPLHNMNQRRA